eukprot:6455801-Prymnesium_polylepis.1
MLFGPALSSSSRWVSSHDACGSSCMGASSSSPHPRRYGTGHKQCDGEGPHVAEGHVKYSGVPGLYGTWARACSPPLEGGCGWIS